MKKLMICCLLLLSLTPVDARTPKCILVYGEAMHQLFILNISEDKHVVLKTVPTALYVPIACAKQVPYALSTLTQNDNQACLIESLNLSFNVSIEDYIQLDIEALNENFAMDNTTYDMQSFVSLQTYFDVIAQQMGIDDILHYQNYIHTNLNLKDLYDFYSLYADEELAIEYQFLSYVIIKKRMLYPLTTTFTTQPL